MSPSISIELQHQITQFLYHEAALLDDWEFRACIELLDDDLSYTMRTTVNAQTRDRRKGIQPPTTWIFNDTKSQLERRIARLETGMAQRRSLRPALAIWLATVLSAKRRRPMCSRYG